LGRNFITVSIFSEDAMAMIITGLSEFVDETGNGRLPQQSGVVEPGQCRSSQHGARCTVFQQELHTDQLDS